jgi:quinol monooxygenase YgiN
LLLRIFRARLRPGHEDKALREMRELAERWTREAEGLRAVHVARRLENDVQHVEVVSVWRDTEALAAALGPRWQRPFLPGNIEDLVDRPTVSLMETIFDHSVSDASGDGSPTDEPPPRPRAA